MLKAKRLQRKGARLFMVNVIDSGVTPMASTDFVEMDEFDVIPPGNLPETVKFPDGITHRTDKISGDPLRALWGTLGHSGGTLGHSGTLWGLWSVMLFLETLQINVKHSGDSG